MSRSVDKSTIEHLAKLARLQLSDAECEAMAGDLQKILDAVATLDRLDVAEVDAIEATSHPIPTTEWLRPDEPQPSLEVDDALHNAPDRVANGFGVPRVVE